MKIQNGSFYSFTRNFSDRVGKVTSFTWASYCGLWQIHQSASKLGTLSSSPEWKKIEEYLVGGVPDRKGIDLADIISKSWPEHQAIYADLILTQNIILYEDWCAAMVEKTKVGNKRVKSETFQFPSGSANGNWTNWAELDVLGLYTESPFLKNEVQPALLTRYQTNIIHLDALLRWFRFYKEVRNAIAHNGGVAQQRNVDAYNNATTTSLKLIGLKRDFAGLSPIVGSKIELSLADSVMVSGIITRLASAFDAKYCHLSHAEADLISRINICLLASPPPFRATPTQKSKWIKNLLHLRVGVKPTSSKAAEKWLVDNNLVNIHTA